MKRKLVISLSLIWISCMCVLSGCTQEASSISNAMEPEEDSAFSDKPTYYYLPVGTYDSADTAIIEKIDAENKTITLYNTFAAASYTLNYDGTTYVSDKYGTAMSLAQLTEGTIVNVNFLKSSKQLVDIQVSPDAWTYDSVTKYNLGGQNQTATIGDRTYALTDGVQVFSQGRAADIMSIVDGDVISVSGIGYDIYSIRVENGHGYVRLNNDESLIGGWIEIGNEVITKVYEDMLIAVPEGAYTVKMYNDMSTEVQDIIVERNQEVVLDASNIVAPEDVFGHIIFNIYPAHATLYLDGEEQYTSSMVTTSFGIHQIEVMATGYDTLSKYINVGSDLAEITINLEETKAVVDVDNDNPYTISANNLTSTSGNGLSNPLISANSSLSSNTTSKNSASSNATNKPATTSNRVYIYSPYGAEVYVDGIYTGLSPVSFKKSVGSHTITLVKNGYITKSYTIYLYDDGDDISVSFSDLEPITKESVQTPLNTNKDNTSDDAGNKDNTSGNNDSTANSAGNKDNTSGNNDNPVNTTDNKNNTPDESDNNNNTPTEPDNNSSTSVEGNLPVGESNTPDDDDEGENTSTGVSENESNSPG